MAGCCNVYTCNRINIILAEKKNSKTVPPKYAVHGIACISVVVGGARLKFYSGK